jgi:hypothetical protein
MEEKTLNSAYSAVIDAPIELVDIATWLLNLPDAEYQRCAPPDHIAGGSTTTDDGRRMSINVEQIGTALVIQHGRLRLPSRRTSRAHRLTRRGECIEVCR